MPNLARRCLATQSRKIVMEESLKDLWAASYDGWINVPGADGVVYSRPLRDETNSPSLQYPASVLSSRLFAVGAWNPMGQLVTDEENDAAHDKIKATVRSIELPEGCWYRHSFGFSINWREPGYVFASPPEQADATRKIVLDLATQFKQGAIYEYEPITDKPHALLRKTVHCLMSSTVDADVIVIRSDQPCMANSVPFGLD
ncbi:unnamed protein product [Aphanomyces euteiches]